MKYLMMFGVSCTLLVVTACTAPLVKLMKSEPINTHMSGGIITSVNGTSVEFSSLIKQLSTVDYILLGELHDQPKHHALQNKILQALVNQGNKPAVVFEMFDREDAGAISSSYRRYPDDPDRIAKTVLWDESGWPDWKMYRPIIKTAMEANLPIVAGNLSRKKAIKIVMKKQPISHLLGAKTALQMGLLESLEKQDEESLRKKIAKSHGGKVPPAMIPGMLTAQRVRDATLAESMIAHHRGKGAVLIAGREHVRLDYGVPFYLRHREPNARIASVAFVDSTHSENKKGSLYQSGHYDFVWEIDVVDTSEKVAHQ